MEGAVMALKKNFIPVPPSEEMGKLWLQNYDQSNYGSDLSSKVLKNTHALIERQFTENDFFSQVLEIGAGTLAHLPFVRHRFDRYIASDHDDLVLDPMRLRLLPPGVEQQRVEGSKLPFSNDSFDRLIATHVLEHVPAPHLAVEEWARVLKPGGVLSIILTCDPGLAWRQGRHLGPRRKAERVGLPYDYYMAREHINSIFNLLQIMKYHFPRRKEMWWPLRVPLPDINLIYAGTFYV
jgi:ubiquinone/menaquinone biosynthesis C-methylase UbiE